MSSMIIMAGPDDWPRYRDIRLRSLQESPTAYGSSYEREIGLTDADWAERLANAPTFLALADDGSVIGTATAFWTGDADLHLLAMYVAPVARGTGPAHQLIDAVVGVAERRRADRVVLQVTEGNEAAASCYRRYGFVATGRTSTRAAAPPLTELEYAYPLRRHVGVGAAD